MELVNIYSAAGFLEAEMIKSFLECYDITVFVNQESLGRTLGLSVGPLGLVEVLVPEYQADEARSILQKEWEDKNPQTDEKNQSSGHNPIEPST